MPANALGKPDQPGEIRLHGGGDLADLDGGQILIEQEDDDGATALGPPSDVHRGDVDVEAAEDRADTADHAGAVLVGEDEHEALRGELDVEVVQAHHARLAVEDSARDQLAAAGGLGGDLEH